MRRFAFVSVALLCSAVAAADGGRLRVRQDAGAFVIAVFTAPEPLSAGPADVSVLVQDRASGEVLLDAEVEIGLRSPGARDARILPTRPGTNRLMKAAKVDLATPGVWELAVSVRRGGAAARVSCTLPVGAPVSRLEAIWPFLAAPPIAVALFALQRTIRRRTNSSGALRTGDRIAPETERKRNNSRRSP